MENLKNKHLSDSGRLQIERGILIAILLKKLLLTLIIILLQFL